MVSHLPDISKWDTTPYLKNMSFIFCDCGSIISLPDISKWNINKRTKINRLFDNCCSLISLPDLSKWNENKYSNRILNMNKNIENCLNLPLPFLSCNYYNKNNNNN